MACGQGGVAPGGGDSLRTAVVPSFVFLFYLWNDSLLESLPYAPAVSLHAAPQGEFTRGGRITAVYVCFIGVLFRLRAAGINVCT